MSKIKVGINGFGRIGRVAMRALANRPEFEVVAINDLTPLDQSAHLLKYDTVHGTWDRDVTVEGNSLNLGGQKIQMFSQRDPVEIPWGDLGVDLVFECTGIFLDEEGASKHLKAGAKQVLLSAPTKDTDKVRTFVMGINHTDFNPSQDKIVSNGSCTTNCLAPMVKVLNDAFGVERGLMTTIHSYTNDQRILDLGHKDIRRMRAAAANMIPTTTGAAKAVALVIPEMKGKLTGMAIRVPTPNVSIVDFVADLKKNVTVEEVNQAFKAAAEGPLKGILVATEALLVSSDYNGCPASSTVDLPNTMVIENSMVKVLSWYDNETGFSHRMVDLAAHIAGTW